MKKFTLEFKQDQLKVLNDALVEMPFKVSAPIIQHINVQIQRQFDVTRGDDPTGQESPKDEFVGD